MAGAFLTSGSGGGGGCGSGNAASLHSGEGDASVYRIGLVDLRRGRCAGAVAATISGVGAGFRTVSLSFFGRGSDVGDGLFLFATRITEFAGETSPFAERRPGIVNEGEYWTS